VPEGQSLVVGDQLPPDCEILAIHVTELQQLFNAIDASPFREKDLSENVEDFIVGWAREAQRNAPLALSVHLDQPVGAADAPALLREAIGSFFTQRSLAARRRLRLLFRTGRISLLIGLACLAASVGVGGFFENELAGSRAGVLLRESFLIGGWVAMWRPLEIFLYDWWPIRSEAKLFDRLSAMPVRIVAPRRAET
jgi:hypothetical protein